MKGFNIANVNTIFILYFHHFNKCFNNLKVHVSRCPRAPLQIEKHCMKRVRIRNFSGPYFPAFGLNMNRYGVSLRIQSERGKIWTRKTPNNLTATCRFSQIGNTCFRYYRNSFSLRGTVFAKLLYKK